MPEAWGSNPRAAPNSDGDGGDRMKATDWTRDDCQLGHKRVTFRALLREYRCGECGGRLKETWTEEDGWRIVCRGCGGTDFVHEAQWRRQRTAAAQEPPELPRLSLDEANELLHGTVIEL